MQNEHVNEYGRKLQTPFNHFLFSYQGYVGVADNL